MNKAFEKILDRLDEMIHPKQLYFCKYARGGCRHFYNDKDCMDCIVELAKEIVQEVAEEYNGGWIPCSERLPEEKINPVTEDYYEYPVIYKNNDVVDIRYYKFGNGHWYHGFQIMDDYVTAWQPLPEPYKESEG